MPGEIAFKVIVYVDGQMEFSMKSTGDAPTDELMLRGWLDKVRESVLASAQAKSSGVVVTN